MDLFGKSPEHKPAIEFQGDKVYVDGTHKGFVVRDEAVGLVYVGMNLESESAPYGCGETLELAVSEFLSLNESGPQQV